LGVTSRVRLSLQSFSFLKKKRKRIFVQSFTHSRKKQCLKTTSFLRLPLYFLKGKDLIGKYSFLVVKLKGEFLARIGANIYQI
jgi:hypothetical protein